VTTAITPTDPYIARLSADERATLAAIWRSRSTREEAVGNVFGQLVVEMTAADVPAALIDLARAAEADEARHAGVCHALVVAYGGEPVTKAPRRVRLRDHGEPTPRMRAILHATHVCCISETIATAFVEACHGACESPALRELHGQHMADEVRHARVGWALLATIAADERVALAPELPRLLELQLGAWTERIGLLPEAGVPGHGYPPRAELVAAVHGAIRELVLPGFDHLGVDTTAARAWYASRAESTQVPFPLQAR
jgi:hypothetical protein